MFPLLWLEPRLFTSKATAVAVVQKDRKSVLSEPVDGAEVPSVYLSGNGISRQDKGDCEVMIDDDDDDTGTG